LYRTKTFGYLNADCNGAANILRKVKGMLNLDLSGLNRGILTEVISPKDLIFLELFRAVKSSTTRSGELLFILVFSCQMPQS
jgi:hypothetical protein